MLAAGRWPRCLLLGATFALAACRPDHPESPDKNPLSPPPSPPEITPIEPDAGSAEAEADAAPGTRPVRGCVSFERRTLRQDGLSPVTQAAAVGLQVSAQQGGAVASAVTDAAGCFEAKLTAGVGDVVVSVVAATQAPGTPGVRLGVGRNEDVQGKSQKSSEYWRWTSAGDEGCGLAPVAISEASDGALEVGAWVIPERCGSGAIAAFMDADRAMRRLDPSLAGAQATTPPSLAVFWSPDIKSGCGVCWLDPDQSDASIAGDPFDSLLRLSGREDTPTHWAPSVIAHELGHWAMHAYSRAPEEQGLHFFGAPSPPGLAYKEGWATAFGQRILSVLPGEGSTPHAEPVYLDMQLGTVFWVDLSTLGSSFGAIKLPSPGDGVEQPIDEFVVAASLWKFWLPPGTGPGLYLGRGDAGVVATLRSERLLGGADRGYPGLDLLDFLDAAVCTGQATSGGLEAMLQPLHYPWDGAEVCE